MELHPSVAEALSAQPPALKLFNQKVVAAMKAAAPSDSATHSA
jgi:hypothetical protein